MSQLTRDKVSQKKQQELVSLFPPPFFATHTLHMGMFECSSSPHNLHTQKKKSDWKKITKRMQKIPPLPSSPRLPTFASPPSSSPQFVKCRAPNKLRHEKARQGFPPWLTGAYLRVDEGVRRNFRRGGGGGRGGT